MKLINKNIKGKEFFIREDTLDEYIAKENCYNKCSFNEGDVWLDIGGNIGVFPVYFSEKVDLIVSFEPDKDNCEIFNKNIELNNVGNCLLVEKAIICGEEEEVPFFLNVKKNKGAHSMFVKRGREEIKVPAMNINTVLEEVTPNKIKMDIEGGEYELIKSIKDWSNIEEFIFEYHINILRDREGKKLSELYDILNEHFSVILGKKPDELGKNWVIVVHCKN